MYLLIYLGYFITNARTAQTVNERMRKSVGIWRSYRE